MREIIEAAGQENFSFPESYYLYKQGKSESKISDSYSSVLSGSKEDEQCGWQFSRPICENFIALKASCQLHATAEDFPDRSKIGKKDRTRFLSWSDDIDLPNG